MLLNCAGNPMQKGLFRTGSQVLNVPSPQRFQAAFLAESDVGSE